MKQSIRHLRIGLFLFLASFANQGMAQSAPQQLKGSGWQASTNAAPAVAVFGNYECVAWKSATSNEILFTCSVQFSDNWPAPQVVGGSGWTAKTTEAPTLAGDEISGEVWLSWKGAGGNKIWYSTSMGSTWTKQQTVSGSGWTAESTAAPALGGGDGITLAWKGASSDDIWYTVWNYPGWSTQRTASGSGWTAGTSTTPAWTQYDEGIIPALFWKGGSPDVWMSYAYDWTSQQKVSCNNPSWTAETSAAPAAAYIPNPDGGDTFTTVFWKGNSSNSIWYSYQTPGASCGWAQQATVSGSGWTADTNAAPAVANAAYPYYTRILAWKNATDNTIWYLDPTTLPGPW